MSTHTASLADHSTTAPAHVVVLARTCRAEWARLWTVRSTWWFTLATGVTVLGLGVVLGLDVQGDPPELQPDGTAWLGGQITGTFGLYGLLALAVTAVTAEHGTGGIVPALQATPRRLLLGCARTAVVVLFGCTFGCALVAGASATVYAFAPDMGLPAGTGLRVLGMVAFVYAASMTVAIGTGLLARSTAGSLVAVLGLMLVLPLMLSILPFDWAREVAQLLPGTSAMRLVADEAPVPLSAETAYWTLGSWAVVAIIAGVLRLHRSDVGH